MSSDGIPPDPYDQIGMPRAKKSAQAKPPKTTADAPSQPRRFPRISAAREPLEMPKESKNRIRAWALWIMAAVIVTILLIVAAQLVPLA